MSTRMIFSKSLELTNYIDPELTWKTVSKGYRRSTRRSRKLIDRSSKFDADLGDGETEDTSETTVSESEKLGVAVLGQRFGDKIEHVPIKKRFMVRSLSPLPCFSSQYPEKNEQLKNVPNPSDRKCFPKLTTKRQVIAINPKEIKPGYGVDDRVNDVNLPEDFSGIEILAAAACNNIVSGDVGNIEDPIILEKSSQDERDLLQSVMSMKAVASLEATHSSPIYPVHEDTKDGSHIHDKAVESHLKHEDSITDERHVSSRDSRLHWDLNVAMDAWGQPCDAADSETDTVQDIHNETMLLSEPCGEHNKSKDRSDIGSPLQSVIDNQEHGLEANFVNDRIEEICIPTVKAVESLMYAGIDAKHCSQSDVDASISPSSEQRSKSFMVSGLVYENGKTPLAVFVNAQITEDPASAVLPSESTLDEKGPDAFLCAEEGTACAVDSILPNGEEDELSGIESNMHEDVKCPLKMGSGPGSFEHKPMNNGEEACVSHTKLNYEDFCSSVTSRGDCPLVSTMNTVDHIDDVNVAHIVDSAEVMHSSSENSTPNVVEVIGASYLCRKQGDSSASSLGRVTMEDNYDDNYDFAFSEKNQRIGHVNDMDEADYDSQYEDGELRETDVPYWGNNACEDDEAECVDYGSDTCDNNDVVKVLSQGSDSVLEKYAIAGTGDGEAKAFESNQLLGSEISSNRSVQTIEKCTTRKYTSGCLDGFDEKDPRVRLAGSRASRMELSRTERSLSSDTLLQKDSVYFKRSGNLDSCNQPDQAGSDHSVNKDRCDSQMADRSARHFHISNPSDSLWDLKHHESAIRHGCFGSGYTRPKSVENRGYAIHSGAPAGVVRDGKNVDRQAMPSSSGLCRPLFRRRSPCSKDDADHMHRGFVPARDMSPGGRSFRRYPQGVNRGVREEYQRPFSNYSEKCFNHVPNHMMRREHNSSPPNRAPAYYRRPYKRSKSRSRSRSPVPWFFHKERDDALKHHSSRSPDYRLEARIERTRLPFQKHTFDAKYNLNLLSPPKRCFSPQHNSCWFDDPNGSGHFRGRRLPGSTFQQNQRFESVGPSRRLNSDGYFEPNMRTARFAEVGRGGRMHRYDDERKRHEGRYDIKRVRRYDSDGAVRRFRYNEEESFMSRSKHNDCDDGGGFGKRPRVAHQEDSVMKRKVN